MGPQAAATNRLTLKLEGPELTLSHVEWAAKDLAKIVREVSSSVTRAGGDAVRWIVSRSQAGSFELELTPTPRKKAVPDSLMPEIVAAIVDGIAGVQARAERPPHFSDSALKSASALANLVGKEVYAVQIFGGRGRATLTKQAVANIDELIGPKLESFGTVEGTLEALTVHGQPQFAIYETLTGHRVDCLFGERIPLDEILKMFGKRVAARGVIRSRKTGERVSIEVQSLEAFPDEEELPSADDIRGILGGHS